MKIAINRKYLIKRYLMIIGIALFWLACDEDSEVNYNESTNHTQIIEPYLQVQTGFVSFTPGTPKYGIKFHVVNGVKELEEVKVYATFTDAGSGKVSNEALVGSYGVESPYRTVVVDSLTYDDLKTGLTVNGAALPEFDEDVAPGSGWTFRFEGIDASGNIVPLAGSINMVYSKYAGLYKVIESKYLRIGVDQGDWNGEQRFIGHVDDITLSYNDFWGPFPWAGKQFNFSIDPDDNTITVPIVVEGIFSEFVK